MLNFIFTFLLCFIVFFFGINIVRKWYGYEVWGLSRTFKYSFLSAILATVVIVNWFRCSKKD